MLIDNLGEKSLKIAEIGAEKIDIGAFMALKTIDDEQTEAYQSMRQSLIQLREMSGAKYIYTMRQDDGGKFIYVVDGSAEEDLSHIGDIEETLDAFVTVWEGSKLKNNTIEVGEWGTILSSYVPLMNKNNEVVGFIGVDYDVEAEYNAFQTFKNVFTGVAIGVMILTSLIGIFFAKSIIKPLGKLMLLMKKVEEGDLTTQSECLSEDEIGELSRSFNIMVEHINCLIKEVSQKSEHIHKLSENLDHSMAQINRQTCLVDSNVGGIAASMEQTSAAVQQVTASSNRMISDLDSLFIEANASSQAVEEIKSRASMMKNNAAVSREHAQQMYNEKQQQILKAINEGKVVSEIQNMAKGISQIAAQTNLLALNASIEAARAGENGRGFMVVAEAVADLAGQSSNIVKAIEKTVGQVQIAFDQLSFVSHDMLEFIDHKVISDYKVLSDTSIQYLKDAEFVDSLVVSFANHSKEVLEAVNRVNSAIEHVAATVEEVTASLQEISHNTGETTRAAKDAFEIAKGQSKAAEALNGALLGLFKVQIDG